MKSDEKKNYIYNVIYRLSICILPLVVTPYVARVLGPEQVGIYSFTSTVACYFILFGKLGLDNYGNRSIASCRDDIEKRSRVFWGIYTIQFITSVVSVLVYILLVITVFKENQIIYWMQLLYVGSVLFDLNWFFYGMERFKLTTIRSLISRGLIIVCVFLFVKSREDLWIYTLVMSACFLLEQIQLIPFLFRQIKWVPPSREEIVSHIVPNFKLFIPLLSLSIFQWMDKIMLGILVKGSAVVAFYTYAENIINLPKGILTALDTVMLPRISNMVANQRFEESIQKMRTSVRFNCFVCCALCFGIAGVSPNFVPFFLGEEFRPVIILTIELALVMIPMSIANVVQTQYLIPFCKEKIYIRSVFYGAAIDFVLNLFCIPLFGASGAIISTLAAEIFICVYQLFQIREIYQFRELAKALLPFMFIGMVEFGVTFALSGLSIQPLLLLMLQVCAGGIVYLLGCGLYVIVITKEYSGVHDIIKKFKM